MSSALSVSRKHDQCRWSRTPCGKTAWNSSTSVDKIDIGSGFCYVPCDYVPCRSYRLFLTSEVLQRLVEEFEHRPARPN